MWDLIVSVPDHCLSFYFSCTGRIPGQPLKYVSFANSNESHRFIITFQI